LISIILMGQPELTKRLSHPVYEPLRQRIGIQFDLKPLLREEVGAYLAYRLDNAGGKKDLFTADAIEEVTKFSGGIPRRINQLASLALLEGFGRAVLSIDANVIRAVAEELNGL